MTYDAYRTIVKREATLRLYLHDPELAKTLKTKPPVLITLEGEMVIGEKEGTKTMHIFFAHKDPDFIPVFIDLKEPLRKVK